MEKPLKVFFSYSHEDEPLRKRLDGHLAALKRSGVGEVWHDRKITAGKNLDAEIDVHLRDSDLVLLCVSESFINSNYCYKTEMDVALERDKAGLCRVVPIMLRPCDLKGTPLDNLKTLPEDRRPITKWGNRDEACVDVVTGIRAVIDELAAAAKPAASAVSRIWNIPHRRNPNFTGREKLLEGLRVSLTSGRVAALTQPQAVHGLGGIGKTQTALEYAYRHAADYDIVWWIQSQEPSKLAADYAALAVPLGLPEKDEQDQKVIVEAVRRRLERESRWLLIFDNAERQEDVAGYIPQGGGGHVLITSRSQAWRAIANPQSVDTMEPKEAVDFLLKRTGQNDENAAAELAKELGYLPLALEQAGAYIDAHASSFASYLDLFRKRQSDMLKLGKPSTDYPDTVATTWLISFQEVEGSRPAAAELLNLCAFLAPDSIPISMLRDGKEFLPKKLGVAIGDGLAFGEVKEALVRYSLIDVDDESLSIHRLVQAVARDRLSKARRKTLAASAARMVDHAFPDGSWDARNWPVCLPLLRHALAVAGYTESLEVELDVASRLFNNVGVYLWSRAQYVEAKGLYEQALRIDEVAYGPEHPKVAIRLSNLGTVLQNLGDLQGARENTARALRIDEVALGPEHPSVAIRLNNLGTVLQKLGDFEGARDSIERALTIDEATYGPDHPEVAIELSNLGTVLRALGDLEGARRSAERALTIDETAYGVDHQNVAIRLGNLGALLADLDDLDGARENTERAVRVLCALLGDDHPHTVNFKENLAAILREINRRDPV